MSGLSCEIKLNSESSRRLGRTTIEFAKCCLCSSILILPKLTTTFEYRKGR
jgi:hypothetical protein